jgi:EmrB/QacA subfamily drug resistance transporter
LGSVHVSKTAICRINSIEIHETNMSWRAELRGRGRWWALVVLCVGWLMIVIDGAIVTVALPLIQIDLGFSEGNLVWIVNAYVLTFSAFLLLGGRLGDFYGHRSVFLTGIIVFTLASLVCALSRSPLSFVVARAIQGLGGAVVCATAGAQNLRLFTETAERGRAAGIAGFVSSTGGIMGVLLGGVITSALNWHWIFLINIPIGIAVYAIGFILLPEPDALASTRDLDIGGSVSVTASLVLVVYAILNWSKGSGSDTQTLVPFLGSVAFMILFLGVEARVPAPLVPLGLFRESRFVLINIAGALFYGAMSAWSFITSLYLQTVLAYTPLQVALAFLPVNVLVAMFSLGLSVALMSRVGIKLLVVTGLLIIGFGFLSFSQSSVGGNLTTDVLPGMLMMGLGCGMVSTPLSLASVAAMPANESGLAAGLTITTSTVGGAVGLAVIVGVAAARTEALRHAKMSALAALNGGYHAGFLIAAALVGVAAGLTIVLPKVK